MPPPMLPLLEAALGRPCPPCEACRRADLGVVGTARCSLRSFPAAAHLREGEDFACLLAPLGGALRGVAILCVRIPDALRLVAPARGADAPPAFLRAGSGVLDGLAARLGHAVGDVPLGESRLHEGSPVSAVLRTHAPPEAAVLSAELRLAGARAVPALAYVVIDPKTLR